MLLLAASLVFVEPAPLDMPRAEAYLVSEDGRQRLEDRYDKLDLWISRAVVGRWSDDDGRVFILAALAEEPPSVDLGVTVTRTDSVAAAVPMKRVRPNHDVPRAYRRAIELLAPTALTDEKPRPPRQLPRGYRDVDYWQHPTNYSAVVCAFRLKASDRWFLAYWALAEGDDYTERMTAFEETFLVSFKDSELAERIGAVSPAASRSRTTPSARPAPRTSERELLRADARHSVAAYPNWHVTDAEEFVVLDDLPTRGFVESLTNEFAMMRAKYAAAVPTDIDGSNVLAVARIYASRTEYLDALAVDDATNMAWTAAYWSPTRRELVAHLSPSGEEALLKTIRHEAFHQYLSYATSMIAVSPWLNEGYAQYFEDVDSEDWGDGIDTTDDGIARLADVLPSIFKMDYEQFYAGTDFERNLKYRLAWSVAVFLEKGAEKVRFQPFKNMKRDYFKSLFADHDMRLASYAAFGDVDTFKLFVREWKTFWKSR